MRPTNQDLIEYLELATQAATEAGAYIREIRPKNIEEKLSPADLVTECDRASELLIRDFLQPTGIAILGEELGGSENLDKTWVIDPIDGTYNFIKGSPLVGVNIALIIDDQPVIGVTYLPYLEELYSSLRGHGVFFNGEVLPKLKESLPLEIGGSTETARSLGAASVELAWFARGIFTSVSYDRVKPWDIAPGALFGTELGATVSSSKSIYWDDFKISYNKERESNTFA